MITQPLLSHPPLLPCESLPSLLVRLAQSNSYEPRSILSTLIRGSLNAGNTERLGFPSHVSIFESIAALTNLNTYELYNATPHHFAYVLTPPEHEIDYIELSQGISVPLLAKGVATNRVRSESAAQFCPLCLKDAPYHRLIWSSFASAACLQHKCLLMNSCPKCGEPIRIPEIIETHCSKCKTDITETEIISIEDDYFGMFTQLALQSWLMEGEHPGTSQYVVVEQRPGILYRVVEGLRSALLYVDQHWSLWHSANTEHYLLQLQPQRQSANLTPYQSYCLHATAFKGIINWPQGFHEFLSEYRNRESKKRFRTHIPSSGIGDELGHLYGTWLRVYWYQPSFEFVQEAFHQYLVDNQASFPATKRLRRFKDSPDLAKDLRYISINEAVQTLETTNLRLKSLIKSQRLIAYKAQDKPWATLLSQEDVLALRNEWNQVVSLKDVKIWLGLSKHVVLKLVQVDLLKVRRISKGRIHQIYYRSDVLECLSRFSQIVKRLGPENGLDARDFISLKRTTHQLSKAGLDTALVLQQVAAGRLCAYLPAGQQIQLGNLLFSRDEISSYPQSTNDMKGWIDREEVAKILKMNKNTVMKRVKAGLISPVVIRANTYYFDKDAIEQHMHDTIRLSQAAEILGICERAVSNLVRQGRLQAVSGPGIDGFQYYIFSRESVRQWRQGRVTRKEVQLQLRVNCKCIVEWVNHGKLHPLEDKAYKPWFFSRQEILSIRKGIHTQMVESKTS